jgi:hypothetical protein
LATVSDCKLMLSLILLDATELASEFWNRPKTGEVVIFWVARLVMLVLLYSAGCIPSWHTGIDTFPGGMGPPGPVQ